MVLLRNGLVALLAGVRRLFLWVRVDKLGNGLDMFGEILVGEAGPTNRFPRVVRQMGLVRADGLDILD